MIGMRLNGVSKEEIEATRQICLAIAQELRVGFKTEPIEVPDIPK